MDTLDAFLRNCAIPEAKHRHKTAITWSSYSTAQRCRRAYWYAYCEGLEPIGERDTEALQIGDAVHRLCGGEITLEHLDPEIGRIVSPMVAAWLVRWGEVAVTPDREIEAWRHTTLLVEDGADTTEVTVGAHCDEIRTDEDGEVYVLERKTTKHISRSYLDRLALDQQIAIQAYLAGTQRVVYDVIRRAPIERKRGETDEEFAARRAEAKRKNKSGTTNITRRVPETDHEYEQRLVEWYRDNLSEALIRCEITIGEERQLSTITQVVGLAHALAKAQRLVLASDPSDRAADLDVEFGQSTQRCFDWGRRCDYWDLCVSGDAPAIRHELYQIRTKREGDPPTNAEIEGGQ